MSRIRASGFSSDHATPHPAKLPLYPVVLSSPLLFMSLTLADDRDERVLRGTHPLLRPIAVHVRRPRARRRLAANHEQHGEPYDPAFAFVVISSRARCPPLSMRTRVFTARGSKHSVLKFAWTRSDGVGWGGRQSSRALANSWWRPSSTLMLSALLGFLRKKSLRGTHARSCAVVAVVTLTSFLVDRLLTLPRRFGHRC